MSLSRRGVFGGALGALVSRVMPAKPATFSGMEGGRWTGVATIGEVVPQPIAMTMTINTDEFRSQIAGVITEMETRWPWARSDHPGQNDETELSYWGA